MPGNEFEKQVQQKMDELQFAPSDAVWPAVERQITEKKKRRFIIWLPFLFLLMGGAAWLYLSTGANNTSKKQPEDVANATVAADTKAPNAVTNNPAPVHIEHAKTIEPVPLKNNTVEKPTVTENRLLADKQKNKNSRVGQNSIGHSSVPLAHHKAKRSANEDDIKASNNDETGSSFIAATGKRVNKNANRIIKPKAATKNTTGENHAEKEAVTKDDIASAERDANKVNTNTQSVETANNKAIESKPVIDATAGDALAVTKSIVKDSVQKSSLADSSKAITKKKTSNKTKKNIEWGAQVNAGISGISNGFSGIFSGGPTNDINSFSSVQVGRPSNSIPNNAAAVAPPSSVKSGFGFSAGVFLNKSFTKGLSIRTGLNYHYYSTTMQVGTKIDSGILAGYYRTGNASQYTNQFHFIELPLIVQQRVGKTSRFAVNAGVSLSVLAASKVLFYDASKISYTKEKSYLNKMQFNVLAGFSYRFFPQSLPLELGPQFSLGISNIYDKQLYGSKHLFVGGIKASIFFHKK